MKMKKFANLCALLLTASLLSGCASTQSVQFGNYWNTNALVHENINETLVYDVVFEKGGSYGYELAYENGVYTTSLTSAVENGQDIYVYKTELTIDVTYTFGEESTTLADHVTTEVRLLPADKGLKPLSSKKSVVSSSPMANRPISLQSCYEEYEYDVSTVYGENEGTATLTQYKKAQDGTKSETTTTQSFSLDSGNFRYLDNEQLLLGLRAVQSDIASTTLYSYSPFVNRVQKIAVIFAQATEGEFEFSKNGGEKTKQTIAYRPVQIQLNEKDPGAWQNIWVASATSTQSNTHRNVILQFETQIYQGLGTLTYKLKSANYQ